MKRRTEAIVTGAVIASAFAVLTIAERKRPLRREVEPKLPRLARNVTLGALALATAELLQTPLIIPAARWTARRRSGILNVVPIPRTLHIALTVLLLDYTLWWWHWLTHHWPPLWRFHLVHHVDRDLDASTALRFHFGEHFFSFFYRAAQIVVIGATPFAVWLWQLLLFASILFHHSNARLPIDLERRLVRFIVTPRMHGIHHSNIEVNTNSNWSSLLSCWDVLHRTLRLDVPQEEIVIGVPAYAEAGDVTLPKLLIMPFGQQRDDWRLSPPDPSAPDREEPRNSR